MNRPIAIATGTRADWGLLLPLARELRAMGHEPLIAALHAHFLPELGMTVQEIERDGFTPALRLPTRREPAAACADVTAGMDAWLAETRPAVLVILGDRFEMLGASTAAMLRGIPVAHIAGGNVTEGAFDNRIRNALSQMASLHFPETEGCARRLREMGIPAGSIVAAGSPGVYNALHEPLMTLSQLEESLQFPLGEDFLLATLHSATLDTATPQQRMAAFLGALRRHLELHPGRNLIITYPNSDTDPAPLIAMIEELAAQMPLRVKAVPSLGRVRYLSVAALCRAVVGNSSSGIEETPSLGVPTLDIGIRQQGRERGEAVYHSEADKESILAGLEKVTSPEARAAAASAPNPYYRADTPRLQALSLISNY